MREHQLVGGRFFDRGRGGLGRPFSFVRRCALLPMSRLSALAALITTTNKRRSFAARSFLPQWRAGLVGLAVALMSAGLIPIAGASAQVSREIRTSLDARGLGRDVLGIIPNTVFDGGAEPPRGTNPWFLRQVANPGRFLDDPVGRFERAFHQAGWPVALQESAGAATYPTSVSAATAHFVRATHASLARWREAIGGFQAASGVGRRELRLQLGAGDIAHDTVSAGLDAGLGDAAARLGRPTLRLLKSLMAANSGEPVLVPRGVRHIVGSAGADIHRPTSRGGVTLITDPGGDDHYDFTALGAGAVLIVVDDTGADTYAGSGGTLSVLVVVDRAGHDRWGADGMGPSSAFGGVAAIADLGGNDIYDGAFFAQAAAALGQAVLFDAQGDDLYRVRGMGQAFAATGGAAVLVDGGGNDSYQANGADDAFDRGGRISKAQGVGFGSRQGVAGGIAALVDLAGDDTYRAELFAQGHGFFFGMGLLLDQAGNDRYQAARYAQGAAAHVGIGVLVDRAGNDTYDAEVGVAQGMGLDRSIGLLRDAGGDDRYVAGSLAQGAATANGLGVLQDFRGVDRFALGSTGWGEGHWSGGLPGAGFLFGADAHDDFVLSGAAATLDAVPNGGPHAPKPMRREAAPPPTCVAVDEPLGTRGQGLGAALDQAFPLAADGPPAKRAHVFVRRALGRDLPAVISKVGDNEHRGLGVLGVLRCVVRDQGTSSADAVIRDLVEKLNQGPVSLGWMYASALVAFEQPAPMVRRAIIGLAAQPDCTARVGAIELARRTLERDGTSPSTWIASIVRDGLQSRCWREQAAAMRFVDTHGPVLSGRAVRPSFLRSDALRRQAFPTPQ